MTRDELIELAYDLIPNLGEYLDDMNESKDYRTDVREVLFGFGAEYTITTLAGLILGSHDAAIKELAKLYETQNAQNLEKFKPAFKWYILAREHDGEQPYPLYKRKFDDGEDVYSWMKKKITETEILQDLLY